MLGPCLYTSCLQPRHALIAGRTAAAQYGASILRPGRRAFRAVVAQDAPIGAVLPHMRASESDSECDAFSIPSLLGKLGRDVVETLAVDAEVGIADAARGAHAHSRILKRELEVVHEGFAAVEELSKVADARAELNTLVARRVFDQCPAAEIHAALALLRVRLQRSACARAQWTEPGVNGMASAGSQACR